MKKTNEVYTIMKNGRPYTYSGFTYSKYREPHHNDGNLISQLPDDKKAIAMETLASWFEKSNKTSLRHTSYGMKHWLENAIGHYVSNNQLKDAMLLLGFEPADFDELNWCFKVKPTEKLKEFLKKRGDRW